MYIYIYIYTPSEIQEGGRPAAPVRPVSVNEITPPEKKTLGQIRLKSANSEPGEQLLLKACRARAPTKQVFVHRHRYHGSSIVDVA